MSCNFPGHDGENILGLCFNKDCNLDPRFCYFCKLEKHSIHQNECIRFDVLNKQIVELHNTFLNQQDILRDCQRQLNTCIRTLLNCKITIQIEYSQLLHKILQQKNYEKAKSNFNLFQKYYNFNKEAQRLFIENIQQTCDNFKNQIIQIATSYDNNQNSSSSISFIKDSEYQVQYIQQENQNNFQQQHQVSKLYNINNQADDIINDDALLQLVLKESYDEAQLQNLQESEDLTNLAQQRSQDIDYAMPLLDKAIELNQNNDEALTLKGRILIEYEKADLAEQYLKKVVELNPQKKYAYQLYAVCLKKQNKLTEADKMFSEAIKRNPNLSQLYSGRAEILCQLNKYDEAITQCDLAINVDPSNSWAYNFKGCALACLERLGEARSSLDKAISLKENEGEYWANKGNLVLKMKNFNEAKLCFDKTKELNHKSPAASLLMCNMLLQGDGSQQTIEKCKQELSKYPNNGNLQLIREQLENIY